MSKRTSEKPFEEWSPQAYRGAPREWRQDRLRECCFLLGSWFKRADSQTDIPDWITTPAEPALAQLIKTSQWTCGGDAPLGFILKDVALCLAKDWHAPAAMLLGVAHITLDSYFDLWRNLGSYGLASSLVFPTKILGEQIEKGNIDKNKLAYVLRIGDQLVNYGLGKVPGMPEARSVFGEYVKTLPVESSGDYAWFEHDESRMSLTTRHVELAKQRVSISEERFCWCTCRVCASPEELLDETWTQINRLSAVIAGRYESPGKPYPGPLSESAIYQSQWNRFAPDGATPFYSELFEYDPASDIRDPSYVLTSAGNPRSIHVALLIAARYARNTLVMFLDTSEQVPRFTVIGSAFEVAEIIPWLPGQGGKWPSREHISASAPLLGLKNGTEIKAKSGCAYILREEIGRGGTALVWKAKQDDGVDVALKLLSDHRFKASKEIRERFRREICACLTFQSDRVVKVLDHGEYCGRPFFTMELLDRGSLYQAMSSKSLSPEVILRYMIDACEGLQVVHDAGYVHRDLSPKNLLFGSDSRIKVSDFGAAKIPTTGETITQDKTRLGSLLYIAPEQVATPHDVDGRADLYAVGAIFYHALTGMPARGQLLPSSGRGIRTALLRVIKKLLHADRNSRPQSVQQVADELKTLLQK